MVIPVAPVASVLPTTGVSGSASLVPSTDGTGFGTALAGAIDNLQGLQSSANSLAVSAVTGNLSDIQQATIAATRAQVTLEVVSAVRNKGVEAFNEIMRMQA